MDIVSTIHEALRARVGGERFEMWFGSQTRMRLRGDALSIEVPNQFFQDFLRSNFRQEIENCAATTLGRTIAVEFRVDPSLGELASPPVAPAVETDSSPTLRIDNSDLAGNTDSRRSRSQQQATRSNKPQPRSRRYAEFESFVVGHSNRVAHATAQTVAEEPGCFSPLYIYGNTGVGKTHLLESIWTAINTSAARTNTLFLSAEQFTGYFLEALHHSGLPTFRRKYRNVDLLVIDDIQFFCGKQATINEFLHTLDTLMRSGKQIVLSGDVPPAELDALGPEITSRLAGGMACRIESPDHATRLGIIKQLSERQQLDIPEVVQEMIAGRFTEHARELAGAVNRLRATSRAVGEPITASLAEEALFDMTGQGTRLVQLPDIERAVCDVFGLGPESLRTERKLRAVSQPRMLAMWLARKHTRSALSEIGDYFGRRSHTTVISAQKRVKHWMSDKDSPGTSKTNWNVEEVIRRVEAKLRVG